MLCIMINVPCMYAWTCWLAIRFGIDKQWIFSRRLGYSRVLGVSPGLLNVSSHILSQGYEYSDR